MYKKYTSNNILLFVIVPHLIATIVLYAQNYSTDCAKSFTPIIIAIFVTDILIIINSIYRYRTDDEILCNYTTIIFGILLLIGIIWTSVECNNHSNCRIDNPLIFYVVATYGIYNLAYILIIAGIIVFTIYLANHGTNNSNRPNNTQNTELDNVAEQNRIEDCKRDIVMNNKKCTVCNKIYKTGDICVLKCNHHMHPNCYANYFKTCAPCIRNKVCMKCRLPYKKLSDINVLKCKHHYHINCIDGDPCLICQDIV
jgi:hypothetical protein